MPLHLPPCLSTRFVRMYPSSPNCKPCADWFFDRLGDGLQLEGVDEKVIELLNIWTGAPHLERWEEMVHTLREPKHTVRVAMVGLSGERHGAPASFHR